jgi:WD40 repeat protein
VWLWSTTTKESEAVLQENAPVWNLTFSPDGKILASGNNSGVTLWDVEAREAKVHLGKGSAKAIAFSPDGILLAFGSSLGPISLWDTITHQSRATLEGHDGVVDVVAFSPDGAVLASAGQDGFVRLWDMNTMKTIATIRIPKTRIWSVAFSNDGKLLVTGSSDDLIRVWDMLEVLGR